MHLGSMKKLRHDGAKPVARQLAASLTRARRDGRASSEARSHGGGTVSPTAPLLLLPVTSLLDTSRVLHTGGANEAGQAHATWLLLAGAGACRS